MSEQVHRALFKQCSRVPACLAPGNKVLLGGRTSQDGSGHGAQLWLALTCPVIVTHVSAIMRVCKQRWKQLRRCAGERG